MRLKKLYIKDYKILKDFTLEFPDKKEEYITVLIGENGAGKSTVLEAIAEIFSCHILKKKSKFGFKLSYDIQVKGMTQTITLYALDKDHHIIMANKPPTSINDTVKYDLMIKYDRFVEYNLLPDGIVIYYSGLSELMKSIVKPHLDKYRKELQSQKKSSITPNLFFYYEPFHFNMLLLSLLSIEHGDIPKLLQKKFGIKGLSDFSIKRKIHKKKGDDVINLFSSRLLADATNIDIISKTNEVYIYKNPSSIKNLRGFYNEKEFFNMMNMSYHKGLIESIEVSVIRRINENDVIINSKGFSEGEQQAIIIMGLNELVLNRNSIALFDEPDVYLHPKWQKLFIKELQDYIKIDSNINNNYLITSHSPQLLSNLKPDNSFVKIIHEGILQNITPKYYGKSINFILFEIMGVEERNEEVKKKLKMLFNLIELEKINDSKEILSELENILGEDDPDLLKANIQLNYIEADEEDCKK